MTTPCQKCEGSCCTYMIVDAGVGVVWDEHWLEVHNSKQVADGIEIDMPCNQLVDGQCAIYENRPMSCKLFRLGSDECIKAIIRAGKDPAEVLA